MEGPNAPESIAAVEALSTNLGNGNSNQPQAAGAGAAGTGTGTGTGTEAEAGEAAVNQLDQAQSKPQNPLPLAIEASTELNKPTPAPAVTDPLIMLNHIQSELTKLDFNPAAQQQHQQSPIDSNSSEDYSIYLPRNLHSEALEKNITIKPSINNTIDSGISGSGSILRSGAASFRPTGLIDSNSVLSTVEQVQNRLIGISSTTSASASVTINEQHSQNLNPRAPDFNPNSIGFQSQQQQQQQYQQHSFPYQQQQQFNPDPQPQPQSNWNRSGPINATNMNQQPQQQQQQPHQPFNPAMMRLPIQNAVLPQSGSGSAPLMNRQLPRQQQQQFQQQQIPQQQQQQRQIQSQSQLQVNSNMNFNLLSSAADSGAGLFSNSIQSNSITTLSQQQSQSLTDSSSLSYSHRDSDREMIGEKPTHLQYMFGFRVKSCDAFLQGNCQFDGYTCFDAHSRVPRRRKPLLQNGRFNYIPTRCRYILEERQCPQDIHCRFAHVTEEVIYHPSKYKTQMCSHQLDVHQCCTGYGMHCAKAHSIEDRRHPVYERADADINQQQQQQQQPIMSSMNISNSINIPPSPGTISGQLSTIGLGSKLSSNYYDFAASPAERDAEREYYMYQYKVNKCIGYPWNCVCDGLDWHRDEERRRGPDIRYAPMCCPNVKPYLNAEWGNPVLDCSGRYKQLNDKAGRILYWDCEYCHTLLELMYHPAVYKSSLCDHFDESEPNSWKCVWKKRCAHSHGAEDLRDKEQAQIEWKQHLATLPPITAANTTVNQLSPPVNRLLPPSSVVGINSPSSSSSSVNRLPTLSAQQSDQSRLTQINTTSNSNRMGYEQMWISSNQSQQSITNRTSISSNNNKVASGLSVFDLNPSAAASASAAWIQSNQNRINQQQQPQSQPPADNFIDYQPISGTRLYINPSLLVSDNSDGLKIYSGLLMNDNGDQIQSQIGIKSINMRLIQSSATGTVNQLLTELQKQLQISRQQPIQYFIRLMDCIEGPDAIYLLFDCFPMQSLLSTVANTIWNNPQQQQPLFQPLKFIQQLLIAVAGIHSIGLVHGDIRPNNISIDQSMNSIRLMDRIHIPNNQSIQSIAGDIQSIGSVAYWLLTNGRLPRIDMNSIDYKGASSVLDLSDLSPTAAAFIQLLLLQSNPPTAEQLLIHPIFYSPSKAIAFLCTVSNYISHRPAATAASDSSLDLDDDIEGFELHHMTEVSEFCDELESLKSTILPLLDPQSIELNSSRAWASGLHQSLFERHMSVPGQKLQSESVVSLLKFISSCCDHLNSAPLVSCHLHTLFRLPHLNNCPRPPKKYGTDREQKQQDNEQQRSKLIFDAVADYFLQRFPALLIAVYQLVEKRWNKEQAFQSYLNIGNQNLTELISTNYIDYKSNPTAVNAATTVQSPAININSPGSGSTASMRSVASTIASPSLSTTSLSPAEAPFSNSSSSRRLSMSSAIDSPTPTNSAASGSGSFAATGSFDFPSSSSSSSSSSSNSNSIQNALLCPYHSTITGESHLLIDPILTNCCSQWFCRNCLPAYIQSLKPVAVEDIGSDIVGICNCGIGLTSLQQELLSNAPTLTGFSSLINALKLNAINQSKQLTNNPAPTSASASATASAASSASTSSSIQ